MFFLILNIKVSFSWPWRIDRFLEEEISEVDTTSLNKVLLAYLNNLTI